MFLLEQKEKQVELDTEPQVERDREEKEVRVQKSRQTWGPRVGNTTLAPPSGTSLSNCFVVCFTTDGVENFFHVLLVCFLFCIKIVRTIV